MKLLNKLALFITLSKLAIVLLFVLLLPTLVEKIASQYTNYYLQEQKKKVLDVVSRNGVEYYLQGQESYGSYTMLKEEYIALEPVTPTFDMDTIETAARVVEQDTLTYRILSHTFSSAGGRYLLEVGKTTATISQYNRPLQRIALYVLITLVLVTLIIDLVFTRYLIEPLNQIIQTKLLNRKFPFKENTELIRTSTTDFRYLDNSLINLMDQINEAFEKEREFTANASHELMTPISILKSKIENLMLHEDVTEEVQTRLIEMMKTLNRLKKIVHSLLLISRIENEQFAKSDRVKVSELIEEVKEEIQHRLEEQDIDLRIEIKQEVILKHCNKDLLFQFFYNFINNAIKYNKAQGSITVRDDHSAGAYSLYIIDTGIGIPQSDVQTIFDRFKKANLSKTGGYGLGLAIAKSIAAYHEIEVQVESQVNKGTTFKITFPKAMVQARGVAEVIPST